MSQSTRFKVEFWIKKDGTDYKCRNRYYSSADGMAKAGARWKAKGRDHWCRYSWVHFQVKSC